MECEVLVVGGGPAGSIAAKFLSESGIDTVIVEKNLQFEKPCGGGIPSMGLKDIGILEEVEKNLVFNRIKKIKIVPPFSSPIEVDFVGGEIFIVNRLNFDSFLQKMASEKGAEIIEAELVDIELCDKRIKATVRRKSGELLKIQAKFLIAADGVNSRVCSILGIKKPDFYWTVSLHLPEKYIETKETIEFWFGSSHASFFYSWVFPGVDYVSVGTGAENIKKLKPLIENFLHKRFLIEKKEGYSWNLRAYKIPRWTKRAFFKGNVIFCGDTMAFTMPVSFEGIYYAMKSGQLAAEALIQGDLKLYEKMWNDKFLTQFRMMKKFQDLIFGNDKKIDEWLDIHRDPAIQELAMALWLRKEHGNSLIPLYLKAFKIFVSRMFLSKLK